MARFDVAFEGRWQETFDDFDEAVAWAEEVAATGRTVDVARRRLGVFRRFVTAFPESERERRKALYSYAPWVGGAELIGGGPVDLGGGGGGDGGGGGC
jgi:hypothetical protein